MQDLNVLTTFVAVVRHNSFVLAADALGISRALVTKQIQALETSLGVQLLHRTTRRLGLTQAGERFYKKAVLVLEQAEEAFLDVEAQATSLHGVIRLSAGIAFGRLHVIPAIAAFVEENPGVQIDVSLSDHFADLVSGGCDLIVRMADTPRLSNLVARKLCAARFILVASPDYLKRAKTPLAAQDLRNCNCIRYSTDEGSVWSLESESGVEEVRVSGSIRANNADGILEAAISGVGIGMLPTFAASAAIARGELVQIMGNYRLPDRTLYAMFLPQRRLPERLTNFVKYLQARLGPEPYWDRDLPRCQ